MKATAWPYCKMVNRELGAFFHLWSCWLSCGWEKSPQQQCVQPVCFCNCFCLHQGIHYDATQAGCSDLLCNCSALLLRRYMLAVHLDSNGSNLTWLWRGSLSLDSVKSAAKVCQMDFQFRVRPLDQFMAHLIWYRGPCTDVITSFTLKTGVLCLLIFHQEVLL